LEQLKESDAGHVAAHDHSHPDPAPSAGKSCCGQAKRPEAAPASAAAPGRGCGCAKSAAPADSTPSAAPSCCSPKAAAPTTDTSTQLKDPVCGMTVTAASPHVLEHDGKPVYFCSTGCKTKFAADPAKYLSSSLPGAAPGVQAPAPEGTIYTCPMHPQIRQDHLGACPICGMALEPEMPSLDEGENPRCADQLVACALGDRHRLAGQHRFIDRAAAFYDHTVDRDLFAGTHAQ